MATATKTADQVHFIPARTEVTPGKVTLVISVKQAETLRAVCARIGGSPSRSPRGDMDAIGEALYEAGVIEPSADVAPTQGSIYFKD